MTFEVERPPTELALRRHQASILRPSEPFGRDQRVVETLLKQARMEVALGDIAAAVARLTQAVRYYPTVAKAWLLKGRCHCMLGEEDDAIEALGVLADLTTTTDGPDARALDELRHAALQTFHSRALQDARLQLRRRAAAAAVRTLRSVPEVLCSDHQFTAIWIYAHERLQRWRVWRRTTPPPQADAALQAVLEWLLAEELEAVSEVVDQVDPPAGGTRLLATEKIVLAAEKIDERCAKVALLHSEIELRLPSGPARRRRRPVSTASTAGWPVRPGGQRERPSTARPSRRPKRSRSGSSQCMAICPERASSSRVEPR